jgi:hypothetical protein
MKWFRVYDELIDDPKLLGESPEICWRFIQILAITNRQKVRGSLPSLRDLAILMRLRETNAKFAIDRLISAGLIDQDPDTKALTVHGWNHRQFKTDDIAARSKHHRNVTRNVTRNVARNVADSATRNVARNVSATPPDSELREEKTKELPNLSSSASGLPGERERAREGKPRQIRKLHSIADLTDAPADDPILAAERGKRIAKRTSE